jgi:intracellular septation protein
VSQSSRQGGSAAAPVEFGRKQGIKLAIELGPLVLFLLVNARFGVFWGTGTFMAATGASLVVSRMLLGRTPMLPIVSGAFVLVFGGLTLWLQDDVFIKMKPTIVYALFAILLFGGVALNRPVLAHLFGEVFRLTEQGWRILSLRWAVFFLLAAGLNEIVWRSLSTELWLSFKLLGLVPLTMLFAVAQVPLLRRHEPSPPASARP